MQVYNPSDLALQALTAARHEHTALAQKEAAIKWALNAILEEFEEKPDEDIRLELYGVIELTTRGPNR